MLPTMSGIVISSTENVGGSWTVIEPRSGTVPKVAPMLPSKRVTIVGSAGASGNSGSGTLFCSAVMAVRATSTEAATLSRDSVSKSSTKSCDSTAMLGTDGNGVGPGITILDVMLTSPWRYRRH